MTKFFDKNGVTFFKNDTDRYKTSTVSISIHCPLAEDTVTKNALLPFVLKRGSRDLPTGEAIHSYLDEMYGANFKNAINKKGEDQILWFGLDFISRQYLPEDAPIIDQALYFMNQVVFTPKIEEDGFDAAYLESEKQNLKSYIEGLLNDKKEYAAQRCVEEMFSGDPYGIYSYGKLEQLGGIDEKALYQRYQEILKTCRIDVFVSGNVPEDKVVETFSYLADQRDAAEYPYPKAAEYTPKETVKNVTQQMEVEQAKLCIGFSLAPFKSAKDYYTCSILNTVFGGGPQSKLFNHVREKLSLCYYVYARLDRQKSVMFVAAGIESKDFEKAYDAILQQLEQVKSGQVTEEELDAAKKYYVNALRTMEDHVFQLEDFYIAGLLAGEITSVDEIIGMVNQTTVSDIVEYAKSIRPDTVYLLTQQSE